MTMTIRRDRPITRRALLVTLLLLLLALAPRADAAITYSLVQPGTADADPAQVTLSVTAGNLLTAFQLQRSGTSEADFTISDTGGHTWTIRASLDIELADATFRRSFKVWSTVATVTGSITVTGDDGTANPKRLVVGEWEAGAAVTWAFEAAASNDNGATSNAASIATGTTASVPAGDQLLIGAFFLKQGTVSTNIAVTWATENLSTVITAQPGLNGRGVAIGFLQDTAEETKASTATYSNDPHQQSRSRRRHARLQRDGGRGRCRVLGQLRPGRRRPRRREAGAVNAERPPDDAPTSDAAVTGRGARRRKSRPL